MSTKSFVTREQKRTVIIVIIALVLSRVVTTLFPFTVTTGGVASFLIELGITLVIGLTLFRLFPAKK